VAVEKTATGWRIRLRYGRLGDKELRTRFRMPTFSADPAKDRKTAEDRATRLERMAARLSATGKSADAKVALERAAEQVNEKDFASIERAVDAIAAEARREAGGERKKRWTFRDVAELWLSGELHRTYPDNVKFKSAKSVSSARGFFAILYPAVGEIPVEDFTIEDAEAAKRLIPEGLEQGSRRHYATLIRRVMSLAEYPLRLIERSPIPRGFVPPEGKPRRAFPFLYPEEDALLVGCSGLSVGIRIAYGFGSRNGCRPGEIERFTWGDFELSRAIVHLDKNKTNTPRSWALSPDVVRALLHYRGDATDDQRAFPEFQKAHLSRTLRMQLKACGVTRAHLFALTDERRPIRAHDLFRSTFVTVALASGRSEDWVKRHTGHTTSEMVSRYRRKVDAMHLQLPWFNDLDSLIYPGQQLGQGPQNPPENDGPRIRHRIASEPSTFVDPDWDAATEKSSGRTSGAGPAEIQGVGQAHAVEETTTTKAVKEALRAPPPQGSGKETSGLPVPPSHDKTKGAEGVVAGLRDQAASAPADPIASAIADLALSIRRATEAGQWDLAARMLSELEALRLRGGGQ
jgi:integrase